MALPGQSFLQCHLRFGGFSKYVNASAYGRNEATVKDEAYKHESLSVISVTLLSTSVST